jgi:hydrogenase nickel incorporation protein HypA/HybF
MHEASVARSILEIVERALQDHPGVEVRVIHVSLGALSHIDSGALRFAFDVLKEDTIAPEASLEIEHELLRGRCRECGQEFESGVLEKPCPGCGGFSIVWDGEGDSRVLSIDVDD